MKIRRDTRCFSVATNYSCRTFFKEQIVVEDVIAVQNMVQVFHLWSKIVANCTWVWIKQVSFLWSVWCHYETPSKKIGFAVIISHCLPLALVSRRVCYELVRKKRAQAAVKRVSAVRFWSCIKLGSTFVMWQRVRAQVWKKRKVSELPSWPYRLG